jgi:hypothetical protein
MTTPSRSLSDTAILGYGLLAGGARAVLPAVVDIPVVRTLRGAMFDRMARAAGVTLTAEARRILVDLEEATTKRGAVQQVARWIAGRVVPGAGLVDGARNVALTFGAGALFRRYLDTHRPEPRDPVIGEVEATRLRHAMHRALGVLSLDQVLAWAHEAALPVRTLDESRETSIVQRYSDAIVSTVAELPAAWLESADATFARIVAGAPR